MRRLTLAIVLCALVGVGAGCGPEAQKPAEGAPPSGSDPAKVSSTTSAPPTAGQTAVGAKPEGKEVVTPSGLHYIDVKIGTGAVAKSGDAVKVAYTGTLIDGTKFDSSYDHPGQEPIGFTLGRGMVIAGWDEGVAGMKVGGKRQLIIPPKLAYRDQGQPGIPPNSTLKFDVELVSVE